MFDIIGKDPLDYHHLTSLNSNPLLSYIVLNLNQSVLLQTCNNDNIYLQHVATHMFLQLLLDLFVANNDA